MTHLLIHRSATRGEQEGRYIGCRTDESLCAEGIAELTRRRYPPARRVFVSPMKRCFTPAFSLKSSRTSGNATSARSRGFATRN